MYLPSIPYSTAFVLILAGLPNDTTILVDSATSSSLLPCVLLSMRLEHACYSLTLYARVVSLVGICSVSTRVAWARIAAWCEVGRLRI